MAASLYTLADIRTVVYSRLENNTLFWPTAEVDTIINEAIRCTNLLTGFYEGSIDLISVANQLVYSVPLGMLYPQRVTFNNIQLDPIPITRIGQDYRTWAVDTSARNGAVARWIPIGINYFCLHPADSLGGQTISVYGILEPPLLVDPTITTQTFSGIAGTANIGGFGYFSWISGDQFTPDFVGQTLTYDAADYIVTQYLSPILIQVSTLAVPISGLTYTCIVPTGAAGTDTMVLDDNYITIIVEYCASRLPLKIGGSNSSEAAMLYTKGFQPAVRKLTNLQNFIFPKYWQNSGAPAPEGKIT